MTLAWNLASSGLGFVGCYLYAIRHDAAAGALFVAWACFAKLQSIEYLIEKIDKKEGPQ